jgi:hypothetical protein
VRTLAALAVACLTLSSPVAVAAEPGSRNPCTSSNPLVVVGIQDHRIVRLRVSNPCPDRVVWVSWWPSGDVSESDFDALAVDPGVQFDWGADDLDRLYDSVGLSLAADEYVAGTDVIDYCWDTDGTIYRVTAAGVSRGEACPSG